jgi:hypothetical protein
MALALKDFDVALQKIARRIGGDGHVDETRT